MTYPTSYVDAVIAAYRGGKTAQQIAGRGNSTGAIYRILQQHNIPRDQGMAKTAWHLDAIRLHEQGFSIGAICRRLNKTRSQVSYALKLYREYLQCVKP